MEDSIQDTIRTLRILCHAIWVDQRTCDFLGGYQPRTREYLDVFCTAYLDDVLVYTNGTLEEHREHVRKVLKRLQEYRLLIHPDKSEFHRKKVTYLRFIISPDRISMDPEKI